MNAPINLCSVAYGILAYALGNMILIPVNAIVINMLQLNNPDVAQVLLSGVIMVASFAGLREVVETISEFGLTPDPL